jgi:hypothetical protein
METLPQPFLALSILILYRSDYEMLLALDEMNGSHRRGASRNQIERLPVSEIQVLSHLISIV